MRIHLRAGEKFYVNGAVIQVDRKVAVKFLNDVTFLLENHVLQPEQAVTPLKQLYFIVQMTLIDPANSEKAQQLFAESCPGLIETATNQDIKNGLELTQEQFSRGRIFDALKSIRTLFPFEDKQVQTVGVASEKNDGLKSEVL